MRTIKPRDIGVLHRFYEDRRRFYLAVSTLSFFPFEQPRALLSEQELWPFVTGRIGKQPPLDIGMPKPRGELLAAGECFAPGGRPAGRVEVKISLGPLCKRLVVSGDRAWLKNSDHFDRLAGDSWLIGDPEPFTEMPLGWDRAFGGEGFEQNPLGKGFLDSDAQPEPGASPLPNLELPDQMMAGPWAQPAPAGFMPLDINWPQRRNKSGSFDQAWLQNHFPGLPPDADWTMYNAAPDDQQIQGFWAGDEEFSIQGMHPRKEQIRGRLPGLRPRAFLNIRSEAARRFAEVPLNLDTVWLFPHEERGVLIHRGTAEIESWDGVELRTLLLAYEYLGGRRRAPQDYWRSLRNRYDREKAVFWALREDDLHPPEGAPQAEGPPAKPRKQPPLAALGRDMTDQAKREARRAMGQAEAKLKDVCAKFKLDPAKYLPKKNPLAELKEPPRPPQPPLMRGMKDMPALMTYLAEEIPKLRSSASGFRSQGAKMLQAAKEQAEAKKGEAQQKLEEVCAKFKVDHQELMQKARDQAKGFDPQKDDLTGPLKKLRAQLDSPGARPPTPEAQANMAQAKAKLDQSIQKIDQAQGKLKKVAQDAEGAMKKAPPSKAAGAHVLAPPELKPADELRKTAREALAAAAAGRSLAGWDLAGVDLSGANLAGADLKGADLDSARLAGADFSGADLSGAILARAEMDKARFRGAKLAGANLGKSRALKADFSQADLSKAVLAEADLSGAVLRRAKLGMGLVQKAKLAGADLSGVQARQAVFIETDFSGAIFRQARLGKALFQKADLGGADFSGARAPGATFAATKAVGAKFDGAHLENLRLAMGADFSGASFRGAQAPRGNWRSSNLEGADFSEALLDGGDFGRCRLRGAHFYRASAKKAKFAGSDLGQASMLGVNLFQGSLMHARLAETDLSGSNLFNVNFIGAQWDQTKLEGANIKRTLLDKDQES